MLRIKYRKIYYFCGTSKKGENSDGKKEEEDDDDDSKKDDDIKTKKTITYKLKFIDSYRFMQRKFSDLVDNLSRINKKECRSFMKRKKIKSKCEFIGYINKTLN